jgi:hypothetical protein
MSLRSLSVSIEAERREKKINKSRNENISSLLRKPARQVDPGKPETNSNVIYGTARNIINKTALKNAVGQNRIARKVNMKLISFFIRNKKN